MDSVRQCLFLTPLQEGTHHKVLAQDKNLNSASKMANCTIVDILKYVYWASEASPTLGCSIEISRDIYICIYVCRYVSYVKLTA